MRSRPLLEQDIQYTLANRKKLRKNTNLLYWYQKLYEEMFSDIEGIHSKRVLEIGSGTSPLSLFYPHVLTSDIMPLDYLDYVFDAHNINQVDQISDESLDIITLTNVLHHLQEPLVFLVNASPKLKTGGQIIFAEPYFSTVSAWIFLHFHPEPSVFDITHPVLEKVEGPLSSANQTIPYMLFFKKTAWKEALIEYYNYSECAISYFSAISYMATGGISRLFPVPHALYKIFFMLDRRLSMIFPRMCSSFFIVRLIKT